MVMIGDKSSIVWALRIAFDEKRGLLMTLVKISKESLPVYKG